MSNILKKSATIIMSLMLMLSNGTVAVNAVDSDAGDPAALSGLEVIVSQQIDGATVVFKDALEADYNPDVRINSDIAVDLTFKFIVPVLGDTLLEGNEGNAYFEKGESTSFQVSEGFVVPSEIDYFKLHVGDTVFGYLYLEENTSGVLMANVVFNDLDLNGDSILNSDDDIVVSENVFSAEEGFLVDDLPTDINVTYNASLMYDDHWQTIMEVNMICRYLTKLSV
jgi:hypothetical protein